MRRTGLLLTLAAGLLAACGSTTASAPDPATSADPGGGDQALPSDLVGPVGGDLRMGQVWHLVGTPLGSDVPDLTLTFGERRVGGPGPVSTWSAEYTASPDGRLALGGMMSTALASSDEKLTSADEAYLRLLEQVDGYSAVLGGALYLFDGDANTLVYSVGADVDDKTAVSPGTRALAERIIGSTEAAAKSTVAAADRSFRVVERDGEQPMVTSDYSTARINVTIEDGKVTRATVG